jgi:ribosomal protein S18 acetylase RimI-like enzyme
LFFLFPKAVFPLTPTQLQDAIEQRSDSMVVELSGEIVAFANFYRWESGGRCSIGNVIVSPAARGRGVGRYLIEQMLGLAFSKHQASEVTVSCFNQNVAGLLLYPKLGFQPYAVEERQNKKGNRVALIHMRLQRNEI